MIGAYPTALGAILVALYVAATTVPGRFDTYRVPGGAIVFAAITVAMSREGVWAVAGVSALVGGGGLFAFTRWQEEPWWILTQGVALYALALVASIADSGLVLSDGAAGPLIVFSGLWITVRWGGIFVAQAITPFTERMYGAPPSADGLIAERGMPKGFAAGGRAIGRWERLLIFLFVLANAPTAIGFLVTAKSILRFGEIRDGESQREAEYILIGTLMSFGFALAVSYMTRLALLVMAPGLTRMLSSGGL